MRNLPLIAIVDDDAAMREALGAILQVAGLSSRAYPSPAEFLDDYSQGRFGLVLTDLKMPGMSGFELLDELRALGTAPPAIIVTSSDGIGIRARAIECGAIACLTKPIKDDVLVGLALAVLGARPGSFGEP